MSSKTIYTCDMCGKEIGAVGPIIFIQDTREDVLTEAIYDLCDDCLADIKSFIESNKRESK